MAWDQVLEAHLRLLRQLQTEETVQRVSRRSRIKITPTSNSASSHEDIVRYMSAVGEVLGKVPAMSAKMKINTKARELGLSMA